MGSLLRWAFILVCAILVSESCSSTPDTKTQNIFDKQFNQLEIGMEKTKVQIILGAPQLREAKGFGETWHYSVGEGRVVQFEEGKVTSFGRDTLSSGTPPGINSGMVVIPGTVQIGDACTENKDCKEKNCHFKICSGINNCQLREGMVCASDENCCTGHCSFGICRTH